MSTRPIHVAPSAKPGEPTEDDLGHTLGHMERLVRGPSLQLRNRRAVPCLQAPVEGVDAISTPGASSSSAQPSPEKDRSTVRLRFFNFNMANNSHYANLADLQGAGGRGNFLRAFRDPLADGKDVDAVFVTLVETRLNIKDWATDYLTQRRGGRLDALILQNARRESKSSGRSRIRGWMDNVAAVYNGNLKSVLSFSNGCLKEEENIGQIFGRLIESRVVGVPVPNPKKAFMGRVLTHVGGENSVRLGFVSAHFPVAKLAAALEEPGFEQLRGAKVALARSLRKILRKAKECDVIDRRTMLFLQGDVNSRTVLRKEAAEYGYTISIDRSKEDDFGLEFEISDHVQHLGRCAIMVSAVTGGLAQEWNNAHAQESVRVGDVLVEVNGIRDDSDSMIRECRKNHALSLKFQRKVADVLLEVLRDSDMQRAIQHELGLPPGRWYEIAEYETVHDLPVTYKFLENPARSQETDDSPVSLTIGDIMTSQGMSDKKQAQFADEVSPTNGKKDEEATNLDGADLYKMCMAGLGDDKVSKYGLAYKKNDFRAFRFPACADRVIFWAPDQVADRISFELPRHGYEVNGSQFGSDHRPVSMEVVMHISSRSQRPRRVETKTVKSVSAAVLEESCGSTSGEDSPSDL